MTTNLLLQSPDGGAAMGGIAAHGYVNGKGGRSLPGMSEANLPWPHLRPGALKQPLANRTTKKHPRL